MGVINAGGNSHGCCVWAVTASALALSIGAAVIPRTAVAQTTPAGQVDLDIPAQDLNKALLALTDKAGLQIFYDLDKVTGKRSSAVKGRYASMDALSKLLAGTGLTFRVTGNRVTLEPVPQVASDGTIQLGSLRVEGMSGFGGVADRSARFGPGYQGTPDWVYETPASAGAVSREAIQNAGARNVRDAVSSAPGVYSGEGQGSFPTVSPNIRGVGDAGRVVVSIDGARQNAQDGGRYGGGMGGYGTAFVDSAFIRQVDINKNPDASAGNAGSLGGGVNFRTVNADDIIRPGRRWGIEVNGTAGTNAHDYSGSVIASARIGEHISLTAGFSKAKLGEYEGGTHGVVTTSPIYNMNGRESWSSLVKLEGELGDLRAAMSWMHQQNDFAYSPTGTSVGSTFGAKNDSVSANITWNPENPLINVKATFWLNSSRSEEIREARLAGERVLSPETYQKRDLFSFGGTLQNSSELDIAAGALTFDYGVEAFRDDASSQAMSETIAADPRIASGYLQFNRPGQRDVADAFLSGKWEPAPWIAVSGGLRYDWYRLKGISTYYRFERLTNTVTIPCDPVSDHYTAETYWTEVFLPANPSWASRYATYLSVLWPRRATSCMTGTGITTTTYTDTYPAMALDIDRRDGAWLPSATVEFRPFEWLHPYVSYSQSFRPPTINEAFFSGGVGAGDFIDTSGAANVQLRAEKARTWEGGLNIVRDGLFRNGDAFRFKASAFHRTIEDYIVLGYIRVPKVEGDLLSFVNAAEDTRMKGLELEGNYDAGIFWLGGAATWLKTRWPKTTEIFSNESGTTSGDIFAFAGAVPPRFKISGDVGVRLFDRNLVLGARINHVSPSLLRTVDENGNLTETGDPYTTLDLRASVTIREHLRLGVTANNLTDRRYVPATGNYIAPGRTILGSLQFKF
ncbi:MAG: TonB-dependent hemoglobin/transferrin/lactoferrin family receptor [Sphingobium sp.]